MYSFKSVNLDFDWQTLKYKGTVQIDGYVLPTENGIVSGKVQCHGVGLEIQSAKAIFNGKMREISVKRIDEEIFSLFDDDNTEKLSFLHGIKARESLKLIMDFENEVNNGFDGLYKNDLQSGESCAGKNHYVASQCEVMWFLLFSK